MNVSFDRGVSSYVFDSHHRLLKNIHAFSAVNNFRLIAGL